VASRTQCAKQLMVGARDSAVSCFANPHTFGGPAGVVLARGVRRTVLVRRACLCGAGRKAHMGSFSSRVKLRQVKLALQTAAPTRVTLDKTRAHACNKICLSIICNPRQPCSAVCVESATQANQWTTYLAACVEDAALPGLAVPVCLAPCAHMQ
jgi:hypothetical protein